MGLKEKDLFEILKHENHDLEIVKLGDNYILGCKHCGVDLLDLISIIKDIDEYSALMATLRGRSDRRLYDNTREIGKKFLQLKDSDINSICSNIMCEMKNMANRECYSKYDKVSHNFNLKNRIDEYIEENYSIDFEALNELIYYSSFEKNAYDHLLSIIIKKLNNMSTDFEFYTIGEKVTAGCKTFEICDPKNEFYIMGINNSTKEELEKITPTPLHTYKFKDLNDYFEKQPSWDDEEDENGKYYEFIYRLENDLFDFSNIDINEVIKDSICTFESFDYVTRHTTILNKFVLNK